MRYFSIIVIVLITITAQAKESETLIDKGKDEAILADMLVYYGLDFSHFHLCNEYKLSHSQKIKNVYIPVWIRKFEEAWGEKRLAKLFKIEEFIYNPLAFQQQQYNKLKTDSLVKASPSKLNLDTIQRIVLDYALEEESGVGFALIVEEFNKSQRSVNVVFTFFNIQTREILYAFRDFGDAGGIGMEVHWRTGLIDAMYKYMMEDYYFEKKKVTRQQKKLNKKK